jgi:hypothetical protein
MTKLARKRSITRLQTFYDELRAILNVNTEDFYKRVMDQASTNSEPSAGRFVSIRRSPASGVIRRGDRTPIGVLGKL